MPVGVSTNGNWGISTLPVVLVMTSIILEVVVAGVIVSSLLSNNMADEQASLTALEVAKGGADDAIIRINLYFDCPNATYCPSTYTLGIGSGEACVTISETVLDQEITVRSRGTVQRRERFVKAVVEIIPLESSTKIRELKEIENPGSGFEAC